MTITQLPNGGGVPEWDMADRLNKALRNSGIGVSGMAAALGVTRESVGRWINGRGVPKRGTLVAWSSLTGVDLHWLETGEDLRACRDSNPKPSVWEPRILLGGRSELAGRQARLDGESARALRAVS